MNNETVIPGPKYGLNHIIDAYTSQAAEERSKERNYNPLRPSAAGKCARELAYEYAQFKGYTPVSQEVMEPNVTRLLNLGHSVEYHANGEMKQAFARMPKPIQIKYKQQVVEICDLHDGTRIEGSIDLWLETPEWKAIVDWKSKAEKFSSFFKSNWEEFREKLLNTGQVVQINQEAGDDAFFIPNIQAFLDAHGDPWFAKNIYQINLYGCSEFAKRRGITFCSVMQYGKSTSQLREIRWVPNEALADNRRQMFQTVAKTVDETKDPMQVQKDHVLGSAKCGFCPFRQQCWPQDDAMKKYFENLPPKQWPKDLDRLPTSAQKELTPLFEQYFEASKTAEQVEKLEEKIVEALYKMNVYKIRLSKDQIYRVKRLKTGGPGGGERLVLRRDKL